MWLTHSNVLEIWEWVLATSEGLLIDVAENARSDAGCQLDRVRGVVCASRESVDGRAARRHRAIDAIV